MQILRRLEMFSVVVTDNVGMSKMRENLELGMELFTLLGRHLQIADLLPTHDQPVGLASDLPDHTEGAMAYCDIDREHAQEGTGLWNGSSQRTHLSSRAPRTYHSRSSL